MSPNREHELARDGSLRDQGIGSVTATLRSPEPGKSSCLFWPDVVGALLFRWEVVDDRTAARNSILMHMARTPKARTVHKTLGSPFLTHISLHEDRVQPGVHPFTIRLLEQRLDLTLTTPVTFLVGENGSGKSTLLEALAWALGFNAQGGNKDNSYAEGADGHALRARAQAELAPARVGWIFPASRDLLQFRELSGRGR